MKTRLLLIALMASLFIPMMQAQFTAATKSGSMPRPQDRVGITTQPIKSFDGKVKPSTPLRKGITEYVWDFEDDADFENLYVYDADGDGNNWGIVESTYAHSGSTYLASSSYDSGALDPDNWLLLDQVPLGGVLKFWAMNYSSSYPDTMAVYVHRGAMGETFVAEDFVMVLGKMAPPGEWTEYTVDLSAFEGIGCIAFRHFDSYDLYRICLDDVSLTAQAPDIPVDVTVDPAINTADVKWVDTTNTSWNLRYRPYVEGNLLWEFEEDTQNNTNTELTGGWTSIDADGDGNGWYHLTGSGFNNHSGIGHVTSASYLGAALTPDNWLVSPKVKLDGRLSFWAAGQDASYASEVFAVYVSTDTTDMANWTPISDDITATGTMTEYSFDLTKFEGVDGFVAIRHYHVTDMFRLNVDDIALTYTEVPDWIYVYDLNQTNYTIEGLSPETAYEVQVQGIDAEGTTSEWTESTVFVTLPDITGIDELNGDKQVASRRYFNAAGQEMRQANGVTIVVTTYTDGSTSTAKVLK